MTEIIALLFLAAIAWLIVSLFRRSQKDTFCKACGHVGKGETHTRGNVVIEIVLWLFFIVPGLIYTIWRHATRKEVCSVCGAASLIPSDSPIARKMRKELSP